MGMLKPYCLFLKIWVHETYVRYTQKPKSDKCYFVKVIPKGLVFLYHYTKAKLFVCLERCILKKIVSCKRVSGRTVQLVRIVESSNKCAAEPHRLDKTRTIIHDM